MQNLYDAVGGHDWFVGLVDRFYDGVETDDVLAPMYPADDMAGARVRLTMFLEQFWGGPDAYSQQRGHPRLRMRHHAFPIDPAARDRWLAHMTSALEASGAAPILQAEMLDYFDRAAHALTNRNPMMHREAERPSNATDDPHDTAD